MSGTLTYPEALNGLQKLGQDYLDKALPGHSIIVTVQADSVTGTASVSWHKSGTSMYVMINMPVRPAQYRMTAGEFDHWAAYLLHEIGHPLHTDKLVWDAAVAANQHRMLNALDDVRQEKLTIDMGLALNAKKVFSALVDSLLSKSIANGYNPNERKSFGWTIAVLGRANNGYDVDANAIRSRLDPNGEVAKVLAWVEPALASCVTTQDCFDLAKRILAAFPKMPEDMPTNPGQGEPTDGEDADASPSVDSDGNEPAEGQGEPNAEPNEGKEGRNGGSGAGEGKPSEDSDFDDVGLAPNQRDNLSSGSNAERAHRRLISALRKAFEDKRQLQDIRGRSVQLGGGTSSVTVIERDASKMGRQRALLARALKREELDTFEGNRQHGKLNRRALAKLIAGETHVFGKKHVTEGYDTDVQILVDGSGSMSGSNIWAASTLALVVAQAARQVGVDCSAVVFNDNGLHEATKGKARPKANKFAYMISQIMGGTPLTVSMLRVAAMQARRAPGKRKVLFTITDGGCNQGPQVLKEAASYIENCMGIEVANLHIGEVAMGVFRNECAVDVNKVASVGLERLTQTLERGI